MQFSCTITHHLRFTSDLIDSPVRKICNAAGFDYDLSTPSLCAFILSLLSSSYRTLIDSELLSVHQPTVFYVTSAAETGEEELSHLIRNTVSCPVTLSDVNCFENETRGLSSSSQTDFYFLVQRS